MAKPKCPWIGDRLRRERLARGWTQLDAVSAMHTFSSKPLYNDTDTLLRKWKRWEAGSNYPDEDARPLIAAMFNTTIESIFQEKRSRLAVPFRDTHMQDTTGITPVELLQRIQRTSVDKSTVEALDITVEQLCCDYASSDAQQLMSTSQDWLSRIRALLGEHLTLSQHRDVLVQAGTMALLVGCLENDLGVSRDAEMTRRIALELGKESEYSDVIGWAFEMRAWFELTNGNYRAVIAAAQAGQDAAPGKSVAVQLAAQEAKAWARMGERRNVTQALEKGRTLLERLPYPERPDNHFVVDPDKFDFYAMDCYRIVGDNELARTSAGEVVRKSTTPDGTVTSPMRNTEAKLTLGVVAARDGDLEEAEEYGVEALSNSRQSKPSLLMVGSELDRSLAASSTVGGEFQELFDNLRHAS